MLFRQHIKHTLLLAWPLILAQVGHIVTGMVDNVFLGLYFGETEQAAGIVSNQLFVLLLVFNIGISFAITPLIASAEVNKNLAEKASLFKNALVLIPLIAVVIFSILYFSTPVLAYMHQPADVVELAKPFFRVLAFSIVPVSFFFVCKQYCEGLGKTMPGMLISIGGNILNVILNYVLIKGKFGFPNLGYMGSAWATFYARCFMGICFLIIVFYSKKFNPGKEFFRKAKINFYHLKKLFLIGMGSAFQFTFEVAAFVIAGLMIGSFGKESIDAHGIALGMAAFTYMFASGISGAVTIRVGQFKGTNDFKNIKGAGNAAFALVMISMGFFALIFLSLNEILPFGFTKSAEIAKLSSELLIIAAFFQMFDGVQVTALGILRGMEDVKFPTIITLIAYWGMALPLAYFLGFTLHFEIYGIWMALSVSLIFTAVSLYLRFRKLVSEKNKL
ncbi:MAG: MATE family efflux transporter [Bacteroidia bacterium]|nr:MATE family efflux transporter [Bacteroidia bacterium]